MTRPFEPWKEGAIRLQALGSSTTVSVERDGVWVEVICNSGSSISHIVEVIGINVALRRALEGHES